MNISPPGIIASIHNKSSDINNSLEITTEFTKDIETSENCVTGVIDGWVYNDKKGLVASISGKPYWKDKNLSNQSLQDGHAVTLAHAYRVYGNDTLSKLGGRFNLFLWDAESQKGLIATDRFGQMPVYWHSKNGDVFSAQSTDTILSLAKISRVVSKQGIYNYLFFHMIPSPGTIYKDIYKLPPAHALFIDHGELSLECYWLPSFEDTKHHKSSKMSDELLQVIQSSVDQFCTKNMTGAFLSGGLDSSTVAGMLAKKCPTDAKTFSIGFNAEGYDEIEYARIASKHFGTTSHEYYVTPDDVLNALPKVAAAYDEPFGNSSAIPAYFCARLAKENGITTLLAGDGGDELFAGNERYAKQTIFEIYKYIPKSIRKYLIEPLVKALPKKSVITKLQSYIIQANTPLPKRLHSYNFLERFTTEEMFDPSFIDCIDVKHPLNLEKKIYNRIPEASYLHRMLYLDWHYTLADNDLRKVNKMCQLAGVKVEYPLLDDLVVDFSTRLSPFQLMSFNRLRHFYKKSIKGFLPNKIINKSKHGFGLPFGVWMTTHSGLQNLADRNLKQFRDRKILNEKFIDDLLVLHKQKHAGYYGELIWILVMLELWLTEHNL